MSGQNKKIKQEEGNNGFNCCNCGQWVAFSEFMGTAHRNHCPFCLWSKHVDLEEPGDRKSECKAKMKPIGLTLKHEGVDKHGRLRQGELMLIHECTSCGKISINRIASDDGPESILKVFERSESLNSNKMNQLKEMNIDLLSQKDKAELYTQLFGKQ
jgi:predicted RNA-binding Zn-ribbon protein involved in translation (DUF1610 family)